MQVEELGTDSCGNLVRRVVPSSAPEQTKAPWQLELDAMNAVAKALESLDNETRARVLRWLAARFVPEQAPANLDPSVRLRDLELERDLAIAARDTARAEARSQRKIAEDAQAGRVAP